MTTTITGEVERITYESEETSFRVIRVGAIEGRGAVAVVGVFQPVMPGTRVRVTGDFVVDSRHGEQFRAETLVHIAPDTLAGLERYLGSGLIKGIGQAYAKRIVEAFGKETLDVLDSDPDRLKEVPGLGPKRAESIKEIWSSHRSVSNLMMLLQTHGVSAALAARLHERYGEEAAAIVQQSPYRLALDVHNVGFKTADKIARSLGIAGDHPERAQAGVVHQLGELSDRGHCLCDRHSLVEATSQMLDVDPGHVEAAIDALWASGRVVVEDGFVYSAKLHEHEVAVAQHFARLLESASDPIEGLDRAVTGFEERSGIALAPLQRAAVEAVATHKVVVVTGGPGVGKTTIVKAILAVLDGGKVSARLAAPTGRAAKRMSEATGRQASTIHRLLEIDPRLRAFQRNADNPIQAGAIIVDEASMIDVALARALLEAVPSSARLVIVGDADQLPSVGPGAFLRDVIESRAVHTVRLNEIFRQAEASRIVQNAHRIFRGEPPESADADDSDADFFVIARRDPEEAAKTVQELVVRRIPKRFGLDPFSSVQVLAPMHRGPAGTTALNAMLQAALNPAGPSLERRGQTLRVGDKVMQTKNDYDKEVFNGDIGTVESVDRKDSQARVRFYGRVVEYEDAEIDMLTLAYCTSIHKSQGSEYPAVVLPLLTSHFVMLSRNLLYTAVTRAKKLCCLVADPRAIRLALAETRKEQRMTKLSERLVSALGG